MSLEGQERAAEEGYAMAALLVALGVMAVMLSVALPSWRTTVQREKEQELIFRGQQYAHAVGLYQRKYANAFPPSVDVLVSGRFLRKKYTDPITGRDFEVIAGADGGALQGSTDRRTPTSPTSASQSGQTRTPISRPLPSSLPVPSPVAQTPTSSRPATAPTAPGGAPGPAGVRAGIIGVRSRSTDTSIRQYKGRDKYNEWLFVWQTPTTQAGSPTGSQRPGTTGGAPGSGPPGGSSQRPGMPSPGGQSTSPFGAPRAPAPRPRL